MIEESVLFSKISLVFGSDKLERQKLVQSNKKEVHDKVKPELFVNSDIY